MRDTEPRKPTNPGFEVDIQSGGRAYDGAVPRVAPAISPARAAAKARARRRNLILLASLLVLIIAVSAWAWLSNPNAGVPSDAVARVNGEYVYERDIARELDLARASRDLSKDGEGEVPSAASALEEILLRKIQVQSAQGAGVEVTPEERAGVDRQLDGILGSAGVSREKLVASLARYNLTVEDMSAVAADTFLINKYLTNSIYRGASNAEERRNRENDWKAGLAQTAKIERFKPAGAGPAPRVGAEAPDFTLKDLKGAEVKLSSLRGQPVMVNFWGTWCPPCRAEIPTITEMYKSTHKGSEYEILGVAMQSDGGTIGAFAQEFGMTFPVLADIGSQGTSLYHVFSIPSTFFIDRDGIIRYIHVGVVDRPLMEKWLLGK